jgi:tartrate dehydratase alpha subunit/fumarate hydratase class I-like protein
MLYSGKKIRTLRDKKNEYSISCVVRKKNSERNNKTITPPPLQVKWSVPNQNRNENNQPVKFICDLLIKGLGCQNKSYLQILMNCLFDVHLIKDD